MSEIASAVAEERKEIRLTSQDCGAYGKDIDSSLYDLLATILDEVEGEYRTRVGMINPEHFLELVDAGILDLFKDHRLYQILSYSCSIWKR